MIQIKCPQDASSSIISNDIYLNVYDKITPDTMYRSLITLTNQVTKYSKTLSSSNVKTNKERYVQMQVISTRGQLPENLETGIVKFGTTNFPLGFYDVTIYKNTANDNYDPSGLDVVYTGLANVTGNTDATNPVQYSEYTTNDSDTESVYITF